MRQKIEYNEDIREIIEDRYRDNNNKDRYRDKYNNIENNFWL